MPFPDVLSQAVFNLGAFRCGWEPMQAIKRQVMTDGRSTSQSNHCGSSPKPVACGGVVMPGSLDGSSPNSEQSVSGRFSMSSSAKGRLKAFLKQLKDGRTLAPTSGAIGNPVSVFGKRTWWLIYCCEGAADASTLEEALEWNARIVRELNRRIRIVSRQNWPAATKSKAVLELMKLRVNHNRCILNIDHALQREEDVDWKWWK